MKVLVYDFRRRDENLCEIEASLNGNFGKKGVAVGDNISLKIGSDVRCAGSTYEEVFQPCPQNFVGKAKCDICRSREKSFIFTAFDGFNRDNVTEADLERIAGEHVVYFAFFGKDLVKVGVSKLERKMLRQIEQGSHYTLFVAKTPDGIAARQIETLLRQTGLADKIRASQKKELLIPEVSLAESEDFLKNLIKEKKAAFADYTHLQEFLIEPEFQDWSKVYGLDQVVACDKPLHPVKLQKDESVSGKILAIKGLFIMIETPDEIVAICAKDLNGRDIDFAELPSGLFLNAAMQKSMF